MFRLPLSELRKLLVLLLLDRFRLGSLSRCFFRWAFSFRYRVCVRVIVFVRRSIAGVRFSFVSFMLPESGVFASSSYFVLLVTASSFVFQGAEKLVRSYT